MLLKLTETDLKTIKATMAYTCCFRFFNIDVTISSDTEEPVRIFEAMYQYFMSDVESSQSIECYIIKKYNRTGKPCVIINKEIHALFEDELFTSHAHMLIFHHIFDLIDDYLLVHAGVVSKNNKGIIVTGPSSYGKTTLILELISRGYKFLSDEYCPVRLSDYNIEPYPRSFWLRENNPFLSQFAHDKRLYIKNIGSGKKVLVNCADIFRKSLGTNCKAETCIILKGTTPNKTVYSAPVIDLGLFSEQPHIIDELCKHQGIKVTDKFIGSNYIVYRFSLKPHAGLTRIFQDTCRKYEEDIFFQESVNIEHRDYTGTPSIKEVSKPEASIALFKSLKNRSLGSRLLKRFNNKHVQMLMTFGDFLTAIKCYEMKIGRLKDMADMIDNLHVKSNL